MINFQVNALVCNANGIGICLAYVDIVWVFPKGRWYPCSYYSCTPDTDFLIKLNSNFQAPGLYIYKRYADHNDTNGTMYTSPQSLISIKIGLEFLHEMPYEK